MSVRFSRYPAQGFSGVGAACLVAVTAALASLPAAAAPANPVGDCRATILKEGLRYCKTIRRALVRCTRHNLKREIPLDCTIDDEKLKAKDTKAEIRARGKIRAVCSLLGLSQLGFPNDFCPAATDLAGMESCFWETPVGWPGGTSIPGRLRQLCLSAAGGLDPWIQQLGGYPEPIPTVRRCRDSFLKSGAKFTDVATKTLAKCEEMNLREAFKVDCLSYTPVLVREYKAEQRATGKVETECAHTIPQQLGYPTADCNNGGQAPPDMAAVVDCLWRTPTSGGILGALRRDGYATVHALIPPVCGNGLVEGFNLTTQGEECDDGNPGGNDCCNASCRLLTAGSPCDDLDPCTSGDQCDGGGNCGGTPGGCATAF